MKSFFNKYCIVLHASAEAQHFFDIIKKKKTQKNSEDSSIFAIYENLLGGYSVIDWSLFSGSSYICIG